MGECKSTKREFWDIATKENTPFVKMVFNQKQSAGTSKHVNEICLGFQTVKHYAVA